MAKDPTADQEPTEAGGAAGIRSRKTTIENGRATWLPGSTCPPGENFGSPHPETPPQKKDPPDAHGALKASRAQIAALYQKYADLFEFAPVGYLVVGRGELIEESNLAGVALLGLPKTKLIGRRISDFIHRDYRVRFRDQLARCAKESLPIKLELMIVPKKDRPLYVHLQMQAHAVRGQDGIQIRLAVVDVSEQMQMSRDLSLSHQLLTIANRADGIETMLRDFVAAIKSYTACDAVGIRLLDGDGNIPYAAYDGFSRAFCEQESPLSVRSDRGTCIDVIEGATDPGKPFFTDGGSFYTNSFSRLLATQPPEQLGATRNACNAHGYESVALMPVRGNGRIIGLIHVADRNENRVPLGIVQELEQAAVRMGMSIQRVAVSRKLDETIKDLHFLSGQMLKVQETEQRRIAMELHDQIGQNLNVLKLQLTRIFNRLRSDQGALKELCLKSESYIDKIIDTRRLSYGLSPPLLEEFGLATAVRELMTEFGEYTGIGVCADVDALDRIQSRNSRIALYRIFQEGLSNVYKHAGASSVILRADSAGECIRIELSDNGRGFESRPTDQARTGQRGMGLGGMRLRARMIGAELVLESRMGQGTRVKIEVPLSRDEEVA